MCVCVDKMLALVMVLQNETNMARPENLIAPEQRKEKPTKGARFFPNALF